MGQLISNLFSSSSKIKSSSYYSQKFSIILEIISKGKKDMIPDPLCYNYNFSFKNINKVIKLIKELILLR